jgi:glycosyltransferase involved in cell wall biosynthesis
MTTSLRVEATVVIPVYNDNHNLELCLSALSKSTSNHFEVLIVDDGSTEPVKPLVDYFGYRYLLIDGPRGPARARNRGVPHTDAEFVIFIDADVCVHPNTIDRFLQAFSDNTELAAVIGSYDDTPADPGFISQYRNLLHRYTHCQSAGEVTTFWTGCGAMRRDIFLKHGGFNEKRYPKPMIEDIELGTWISAKGGRILLDPTIQCKHLKRWSFVNMVKTDIFQRGIVWVDLMLRSNKLIQNLNVSWSQRLSVGLIFIAAILAALTFWWPWSLIGAALALMAVTAVNMKFYQFFAKYRSPWFAIKSLPLHWVYFGCCGVSVIVGTLKFYLSKNEKSEESFVS